MPHQAMPARSRPSRRRWRLALLGLALPFALSSTAQPPTLETLLADPVLVDVTADAPARPAPELPADVRSPATAVDTVPLARDFDVREFEAMAQALVDGQRVPGLAMAIVHDGRVLSMRGYGITDTRAAAPVGAHTVFRLASLSKGFAGTMAGLLVTEGSLRWDSRVTDFLPGFRLHDPVATQRLTVADVLSHQVGLPHHAYDRAIEADADYRDLVHRLYDTPLRCDPDECYGYQNVAFSLIGDVVFAATGSFFSETVARRIFKPLGMDDASYGLEGITASPSWARPHVRGRGGWASLSAPQPTYYRVAPAAGVNASISDMAQWLIAQTGHRPDVLPLPLLATLHAPVVDTPSETRSSSWRRARLDDAGYGIGWRVYDYAGHRVVYHGGAVQGYRGAIALVPGSDLGVVLLWNSTSNVPTGLMPTILDGALGLRGDWLDLDEDDVELLYASRKEAREFGSDASTSRAKPR